MSLSHRLWYIGYESSIVSNIIWLIKCQLRTFLGKEQENNIEDNNDNQIDQWSCYRCEHALKQAQFITHYLWLILNDSYLWVISYDSYLWLIFMTYYKNELGAFPGEIILFRNESSSIAPLLKNHSSHESETACSTTTLNKIIFMGALNSDDRGLGFSEIRSQGSTDEMIPFL